MSCPWESCASGRAHLEEEQVVISAASIVPDCCGDVLGNGAGANQGYQGLQEVCLQVTWR